MYHFSVERKPHKNVAWLNDSRPPPRRSWQKSVWERIKFAFPCQDELLSGSILWEIGLCFKNLDELWHFIPRLTLPAKTLVAASRLQQETVSYLVQSGSKIFWIHHKRDKFPYLHFHSIHFCSCLHLVTGFKFISCFSRRTHAPNSNLISDMVTSLRPRRRPTLKTTFHIWTNFTLIVWEWIF